MTPESLSTIERKDVAQLIAVLEEQAQEINNEITEKDLTLEQVKLRGWLFGRN